MAGYDRTFKITPQTSGLITVSIQGEMDSNTAGDPFLIHSGRPSNLGVERPVVASSGIIYCYHQELMISFA